MTEEVYAPVIDAAMTLPLALEQVCRVANSRELFVKGFRQVSSTVMRTQPKFVLLAKDNDEKARAVVDALCRDRNVPVILIDSRMELGKIAGLVSRRDKSKVCPCGVAAVLDYGKNSEGKVVVMSALRDMLSKPVPE